MGPADSEESPKPTFRLKPTAEAIRKLQVHHVDVMEREATIRQKIASTHAGEMARAATIKIDQFCVAVEATQDRARHRALLARALAEASQGVGALVAVRPIDDPIGWLDDAYGPDITEITNAQAKKLRTDERRFAAFLAQLSPALVASDADALDVTHIVDDLVACLSAEKVPAPKGLTAAIADAEGLLSRQMQRLHDGGSLLMAWNQVRGAQGILDGALVLLAPALFGESFTPASPAGAAAAYLYVAGGATMVERAVARLDELEEMR